MQGLLNFRSRERSGERREDIQEMMEWERRGWRLHGAADGQIELLNIAEHDGRDQETEE
jgi:hypothetical protein